MKRRFMALALGLLLAAAVPAVSDAADKKPASSRDWTESQKISYILGSQIGQLSKSNEITIDMEIFKRGLNDQIEGNEPAMSLDEIKEFMAQFQRKVQEKQAAALAAAAEDNIKKGSAFLEANKKKKGVKVTASGLQYKLVREGKGAKPKASDNVRVHYRGTFVDGKEFDSSYSRNKPAEFNLSQVIKGWTEGLQLMSVGSKYEFYIPENLAYGKNAPPTIGPNQTLIFEVELLDILK